MYQLSVVVPTFNENENIYPLFELLAEALTNVKWELIFVDDNSTDGTLDQLRTISEKYSHVRFIHRIHERGLATACIEGMLSSLAPAICVLDADMQHDEKILPTMLKAIENGADLAIGSRHAQGGSMGTMPAMRVKISRFASSLSHLVLRHKVTDPMSGFFMISRAQLNKVSPKLSTTGYKLLLDIVVNSGKEANIVEVPYDMRHRQHGESKLDTFVALEYLNFLLEKSIGKVIPVRFILFVLVGATGVLVHLFALFLLHKTLALSFVLSQSLATLTAMFSNFNLNNLTTYRDKRLHGINYVTGLLSFCAACSLGAVINVMVADYLKDMSFVWWSAGLIGAFVGSIWNYSMTSVFTWKKSG